MTSRPQDHVARVRAVFDEWALDGSAEGMERAHGRMARRAFDRLGLRRDSWYLDIGCGNGYTVRWAAAIAAEGRAVGIDVAAEMIGRAERMSRALPNTEFHLATFPDHPLPRGRFDAIFSMEVFYYFPDMAAAVREVAALLAQGGRFACVVDYYKENTAGHGWPEEVGLPMHLLGEAEWRDLFEANGLADVEQARLTVPRDQAEEEWEITAGSLLTLGRRR